MQIPLYFLNKNEIEDLKYIIDVYRYISKNPTDLMSYTDEANILKKLKKRIYLENDELIPLVSMVTVTIIGSEIVKCEFDLNPIKYKKLLIKLISTHQEKLDDEDYVNNIQLFDCIYKTIKNSINELDITIYEEHMYHMLELLNL